ncbi:MAG: response regulator [Desulfovibrionaceae bacterium]|jgi:CheY-like chemotaxis protein|nr:response regulator [Desulfovibrionaceae bacterium]
MSPPSSPDPGPAPAASPEPSPGNFRGRILVVDDNETNLLVITRLLRVLGCPIDAAENGGQALGFFAERRYALVFMDLQMPVLDGVAAVARMRAMERNRGSDPVPIVALSAFVPDSEFASLRGAGFDGALTKPVNRQALLEVLEQFTSLELPDAPGRAIPLAVRPPGPLDASPRDEHKTVPPRDAIEVHPDPEFMDLAPWVVSKLTERLEQALGQVNRGEWDEVRRLGHDLRGEGGTFDLTGLGELGWDLRNAALERRGADALRIAREAIDYLARVVFV